MADAGTSANGGDGGDGGDGGEPLCWGSTDDATWPGSPDVQAVDDPGLGLANNASGLVWVLPEDVVWLVVNEPPLLYRLRYDGAQSRLLADSGWETPATLRYPNAAGAPDAEGVTLDATGAVLVSSERDSDDNATSRPSVLRYDVSGGSGTLTATHEWDLTATLGAEVGPLDPNGGLEAIAFLPDASLVAAGFYSEASAAPYLPASLGPHLGGLVAVGVEETGDLFVFALFENGTHTLIARATPGLPAVMSLEHDAETGRLWVGCDNTCDNQMVVMEVESEPGPDRGRLVVRKTLDRPASLANDNQEGFALGPSVAGARRALWVRDGGGNGSTLWLGDAPSGAPCP